MDEDDDYTVETLPGVQMQVIDVVILAMDSFGDFVRGCTTMLMQHSNWTRNRKLFAQSAALDIERMVSGE